MSVYLIAMVAIAVVGYDSISKISQRTSILYANNLVPSVHFGMFRANNRAMETVIFQNMQVTSAEDSKRLVDKLTTLISTNEQMLKDLHTNDLTPQKAELVDKLVTYYPTYLNMLQETSTLGLQNKTQEAYTYFNEQGAMINDALLAITSPLEALFQADSEEMDRANKAQTKLATWVITILTVIVITLCIVLGMMITRMIVNPIQMIQKKMGEAEKGDFTGQVNYHAKDELGQLTNSMNTMLRSLRQLLGQITENSHQVAAFSAQLTASAAQTSTASEHIANTVQDVANVANKQTQSVVEATHTLKHMEDHALRIASNAQVVSETAIQAAENSLQGNRAIDLVGKQMNVIQLSITELGEIIDGLGQRSGDIGQIVAEISGIAAQTNLLALNAAIEAARAGESGRGFAVVADEVRRLAEQSSQSSGKISDIITSIQSETLKAVRSMKSTREDVTGGMETVSRTGTYFENIKQSVDQVTGQIQEVSSAVQKMASGTEQLIHSVDMIHVASHSTAAGTENISAATEEQLASMIEISSSSASLYQMADDLQTQINQFKI